MKKIGKFILWIFGWKLILDYDERMKNSVIIAAPHTSMWDFVFGRAGLWVVGVRCHFLIKKEMFFFPLNILLRSLGAIPVDRGKDKKKFFEDIIYQLKNDRNFSLVLTPEGTRHLNKSWKKGFYIFAMKSGKPIFFSWLDYPSKTCGIGKNGMIIPSGNYEEDFKKIEEFYKTKRAKYPENFNLSQPQDK